MEKPLITILIVNYNSADFIINSLVCLEKLTKNPYEVLIRDNDSKIGDYNKLKKYIEPLTYVALTREETELRGSMAHGTALNDLAKLVDTPYFSILDADAIWLIKHWDEKLINRINESVKVIGTQAPVPKPRDFPLMFAILFETETFKKLNIDFRPQDTNAMQDTGFEMREKYFGAGLKSLNIDEKNTRVYQEGPFKDLLGVGEYYLEEDFKQIFASHFGRGSTLGAAKFAKGTNFFYRVPLFNRLLKRRRGLRDRQAWIDTCQRIVEAQQKI